MFRLLALFIFAASLLACSQGLLANGRGSTSTRNTTTMTKTDTVIKNVSLMAREEKSQPASINPGGDRPIGFADVFVRLENRTNSAIKVEIQRIEIKDTWFNHIYMVNQAPQTILLHPLEISNNSFHLTNQEGYYGLAKAKAVVTFQINGQVTVVESEPVAVDRH